MDTTYDTPFQFHCKIKNLTQKFDLSTSANFFLDVPHLTTAFGVSILLISYKNK
jgi:hypothetical protein